jgi:plasmid stabilization system protein ParE
MARVIWTDPALTDAHEIVRFIGRDSKQYAKVVKDQFKEAARRILQHPRIGGPVPEFEEDAIREVLVYSYRMIYVIHEEDCHIVAVLHASRDLTRLLKPDDLKNLPP